MMSRARMGEGVVNSHAPPPAYGSPIPGINPLVAQMLANNPPPHFSGEDADWEKFAKEWAAYEKLVRQVGDGDMVEVVIFQSLNTSLDPAGRDFLERRRAEEPTLTFTQFWLQLKKIFDRDMLKVYRRKWVAVTLPANREFTSKAWRTYKSAFELALRQVLDASENEIVAKILQDLPHHFRERLLAEMGHRNRKIFGYETVFHALWLLTR